MRVDIWSRPMQANVGGFRRRIGCMETLMTPATAKIFVLDTNVILHDADCISNFTKSDIVLPITVLEELDKFKRGNENIHFQAREFVRRLDALTGLSLIHI